MCTKFQFKMIRFQFENDQKCYFLKGISGQSLDDFIIETPYGIFCFVTGHRQSLVVHCCCYLFVYFEHYLAECCKIQVLSQLVSCRPSRSLNTCVLQFSPLLFFVEPNFEGILYWGLLCELVFECMCVAASSPMHNHIVNVRRA